VGPPDVVPATTAAVPQGQRTVLVTTEGPLDAERGARSYDVDRRAFTAVPSDDREARAASTAAHPSITDLTLAAVSGNTGEGRGPSDMPGAVSRASAGVAASAPGVRGTTAGTDDAAATRERIYDRYNQEIRARVNRALVWPRALAIRLEQGETVLRFVVRPDGRLANGVQVVKSSGFIEFDQAALEAVRKASPFPPMTHEGRFGPLAVNLRVPFSNPLVR
jgi:TonB family protein